MDDATLARSLASVVVPGELEARRRSWLVTRSAFACSGMPTSRAKAEAPGPARNTCSLCSITRRASVIGFLLILMLFFVGLTNDINRLNGQGFNVK